MYEWADAFAGDGSCVDRGDGEEGGHKEKMRSLGAGPTCGGLRPVYEHHPYGLYLISSIRIEAKIYFGWVRV